MSVGPVSGDGGVPIPGRCWWVRLRTRLVSLVLRVHVSGDSEVLIPFRNWWVRREVASVVVVPSLLLVCCVLDSVDS